MSHGLTAVREVHSKAAAIDLREQCIELLGIGLFGALRSLAGSVQDLDAPGTAEVAGQRRLHFDHGRVGEQLGSREAELEVIEYRVGDT
jgi:hypothetical protein